MRDICRKFYAATSPAKIPCHESIHHQRQGVRTYLTDQNGRNAAIKTFFHHLESNYGNLSSLIDTGPASETIVSNDGILHPHHLARLFQHEATALHVRNFFHPESARRLGEELIRESLRGGGGNNWKVSTSRGLESSDVATLGEHSPYNVAVARDQNNKEEETSPSSSSSSSLTTTTAVDDYFEGVQREFRSRRRRSRSTSNANANTADDSEYYQLWPLDKLRLELEEAWPSGAGLARETMQQPKPQQKIGKKRHSHPRPFGGGLPRIMRGPTRWKRGFIHVDELGPLDVTRGLFSANIYLTVPKAETNNKEEMVPHTKYDTGTDDVMPSWRRDSGGLYVWPLGVRSRLDWYRNAMTLSSLSAQDPEMQLNLEHALGKPNVIQPEPGDLVLLCVQRPLCAVGFDKGERVSLQCFLEHNGPDNRLLIDC